jgi:hypothetical protein
MGGRRVPWLAGLAWLLSARAAMAGPPEVVTRVDCPALASDVRAEFEARARVDLVLRSSNGGELEAECRGLEARVIWRPRVGGTFERAASGRTPPALVDALLVAVAELANDAARALEPPSPAPPTAETKPPVPPSTAAGEKLVRDDTASVAPDEDEAASWSLGKMPLGASLGGLASAHGGGRGIVGPSLGFLLGLPLGFLARIHGGYEFGLGEGSEVSAHAAEAGLLLSYRFGSKRSWEAGLGLVAGTIMVTGPAAAVPQGTQSEPLLAFAGRLGYGWVIDGWRLSGGPEVRFYATPTTVDVNSQTAWEIPLLTAGIGVEIATSLRGSLW